MSDRIICVLWIATTIVFSLAGITQPIVAADCSAEEDAVNDAEAAVAVAEEAVQVANAALFNALQAQEVFQLNYDQKTNDYFAAVIAHDQADNEADLAEQAAEDAQLAAGVTCYYVPAACKSASAIATALLIAASVARNIEHYYAGEVANAQSELVIAANELEAAENATEEAQSAMYDALNMLDDKESELAVAQDDLAYCESL